MMEVTDLATELMTTRSETRNCHVREQAKPGTHGQLGTLFTSRCDGDPQELLAQDSAGDNFEQGLNPCDEPPSARTDAGSDTMCCTNGLGICSKDTRLQDSKILFYWYDLAIGVVGIVLFYADIVFDIIVAKQYFDEQQSMYGGVCVAIIAASYLLNYCILFYGYPWSKKKTICQNCGCIISKLLFMTIATVILPLFFTVTYLYFGCKSRQRGITAEKRKYFLEQMTSAYDASVVIRITEVYGESAPQLVWQLYIILVTKPLLHDSFDGWIRILSLGSALLNLGATQALAKNLNRNLQLHVDKQPATFRHLAFNALWRTLQTAHRLLCLALFASVFHWWVVAITLPHFLLVFCWTYRKTKKKSVGSVAVDIAINAYISVFSFLNYKLSVGERSFYWYSVLEALYLVENSVMLVLWYLFTDDKSWWFHRWGLAGAVILWLLYVPMRLVNYRFCHPAPSRRFCHDYPCTPNVWKEQLCAQTWEVDDVEEYESVSVIVQ